MKIRGLVIRTPRPAVALRALLAAGVCLLLVAVAATPASATGKGHNRGKVLTAVLIGETEPAGGDADGIGFSVQKVRPKAGQVCYVLAAARLDGTVTAAHIHAAPAGVNGPIVVPLTAPTDGFVRDCAAADQALLAAIVANPANYYVNVHTSVFPAGAVRGQLHSLHRH
jgi:hypothetical protein